MVSDYTSGQGGGWSTGYRLSGNIPACCAPAPAVIGDHSLHTSLPRQVYNPDLAPSHPCLALLADCEQVGGREGEDQEEGQE